MLLLDEPLGALDLELRKQLQTELKDTQCRGGITFVHVTHDQEGAFSMSDRVAVMNEGVLEQEGPPKRCIAARPRRLSPTSSGRQTASHDGDRTDGRALHHPTRRRDVGVHRPDHLREGDDVWMIRPENLKLCDGIPARVTAVSYLRPARSIRLENNTLGTLVATVPANAGTVSEDDRLAISWADEDA